MGLNQVDEGDDADSDADSNADEVGDNELGEDFVGSLPDSGYEIPPGVLAGQAFRQRVMEALLDRR